MTRRDLPAVLSVLVLAAFIGACRPAPPAAAKAVSADTWAVVDGREIKRDDVEKAYRRVAQISPAPSDEEALMAKLSLLNDYIVQDILLAKAPALKITVPDADLDAAYAEARKGIPDEAFQQELTKRNLTAADMREGLRREMLVQKIVEQEVGSKIAIADSDVTEFYNANRAQFNFAEDAYHIAQIVVTPVREPQPSNRTGDDAATPQAAAAKTQMVMERLKSGAAFSDLARDFSEDPESAARGGDMGFIPLSSLKQAPPPLGDAVLKSSPGTVKVAQVGGSYTIVLLIAQEAAGQRDLSTPGVREGITNTLKGRKEQLLRAAYLTSARSDAEVVNHLARRVVEAQGKMPSLMPAAPGAK